MPDSTRKPLPGATQRQTRILARALVRETGYNVVRLRASGDLGEAYSRGCGLYKDACRLLLLVDPHEAPGFIDRTYNSPPPRHPALPVPPDPLTTAAADVVSQIEAHDQIHGPNSCSIDPHDLKTALDQTAVSTVCEACGKSFLQPRRPSGSTVGLCGPCTADAVASQTEEHRRLDRLP